MRRRTILGAGLAWLGAFSVLPCAVGKENTPLLLGVYPYASTLALIETFRQQKRYLTIHLGRPVELYTASDAQAFVDTLMAGGYDIAISPPHLAIMAMERDYVPLMRYGAKLEPVLAVHRNSQLVETEGLRGRRIAMPEGSTFIRLVGIRWLADSGLQAGTDYQIVKCSNLGAAAGAALTGGADAGLTSTTVMRHLPIKWQRNLRTINSGLYFPHLFIMAHRHLGTTLQGGIKAALKTFLNTRAGRSFMERTAFGGYREISNEDLRIVADYVNFYRIQTEH